MNTNGAESWRQFKKAKQTRHAFWKEQNLSYLDSVGLSYKSHDNGNTIVVSAYAQFSTTTGRWYCLKTPWHVMRGGAKCFVGWLKKNEVWK